MSTTLAQLAAVASRTDLSVSARLLVLVIADRAERGLERATVNELGDAIGVERRHAFRLLCELEEAGVIEVQRARQGLAPTPSVYRLTREHVTGYTKDGDA